MHRAIQKAFEAVLVAQKKLSDAISDQEIEAAEKELKQAQENLIILEARMELFGKIGVSSELFSQDIDVSDEMMEKFLELLLK